MEIPFDKIVEVAASDGFKFNACDVQINNSKILSSREKGTSASPTQVVFGDLMKIFNEKLGCDRPNGCSLPIAMKIFVDLTVFSKDEVRYMSRQDQDVWYDNIGSIRGLLYEIDMYRGPVMNILYKKRSPNFIPYIASASCQMKNILKKLDAYEREKFQNGLVFGKHLGLPVKILMTGKPPNAMPLGDFLLENGGSTDAIKVIFQCLYTLCILQQEKVMHNDLHLQNILVARYRKKVKWLFALSEDKNDWFYIHTHYVPLFFDWDLGYKDRENVKITDGMFCESYNICNRFDPTFDTYTFLCLLSEMCTFEGRSMGRICGLIVDKSISKTGKDAWIDPKDERRGFKCRALRKLKPTEMKSAQELLKSSIFEQYKYIDGKKIKEIYTFKGVNREPIKKETKRLMDLKKGRGVNRKPKREPIKTATKRLRDLKKGRGVNRKPKREPIKTATKRLRDLKKGRGVGETKGED